jgi:uncharacterized protein YqjF (DUF2071 family)
VADVSDQERLRMRDRPAGRAIMRQVWEQLGFLHWPVDAAALARLLPPGLDVDLFEGVAYVGIVPFTIPLTRAAGFGARIAPAFHEINVRTYVHRGGRDPGVWFFRLDAPSLLAVAGARVAYRLPVVGSELRLIAEVFNLTNRANFANPSAAASDLRTPKSSFLVLNSLRSGAVPRTFQFGVRASY